MTDANRGLVEEGDLDALARHAARLTKAGEWEELLDLRDRCRVALDRGKQLWPVASRAEYLLALRAPGEWATRVVTEGAGLFAPGPLAEVVASTHEWDELGPHLEPGPLTAVVLHERVLRGEDLRGPAAELAPYLDLPAVLQAWEPQYVVATYTEDGLAVEEPDLPPLEALTMGRGIDPVDDAAATDALRELVRPWTADSDGHVDVVAVEGDALDAIASLPTRAARAAPLDGPTALGYLAWTGASGGAHGRRRGAAAGRLNAWWTTAALAGVEDRWPIDPGEMAAAVAELRWWRWETAEPPVGWRFHLAVDDPGEGLAWAIAAHDRRPAPGPAVDDPVMSP